MGDLTNIGLELVVLGTGLGLLLLDLWTPPAEKKNLGYGAIFAVAVILLASFAVEAPAVSGMAAGLGGAKDAPHFAFGQMIVIDALGLFFKRFFLLAALLVLVMAVGYADRFDTGHVEYYALILFALAGMMFAASANNFALLFVSLETITVTFYVLTSFQRRRVKSLEAGVKYLILGALSSGFLVYGIALVYGASGTLEFSRLAAVPASVAKSKLFLMGMLMVFVGLGFKLAAVPFQLWAPDVYQGAPVPTTAFLAAGSKAAGVVLLMRVLSNSPADSGPFWARLLMFVAGFTILYGTLCAIPQRNLKRLLGYSSIANAGFLLLALSTLSEAGSAAVLYYLAGYLFAVLAAFTVISLALRESDVDNLEALAGLHQRSPLMALALALAMVSLAGIPPLAGFFGKFLLLKSVLAGVTASPGYVCLLAIAVGAVVVSLYYYFGVIRSMYWDTAHDDQSPIPLSPSMRASLLFCILGLFWLGVYPGTVLSLSQVAAAALKYQP